MSCAMQCVVTQKRMEIGVRKVLGSLKGMLVSQYLIESLILTLAATMIGFIILELVNSILTITVLSLHGAGG